MIKNIEELDRKIMINMMECFEVGSDGNLRYKHNNYNVIIGSVILESLELAYANLLLEDNDRFSFSEVFEHVTKAVQVYIDLQNSKGANII